jgi:hypothetical protein
MTQLASDRQLKEQRLVTEKDAIRQKEEVEQSNLQVRRRLQKQGQEMEKEAILLSAEKFRLEMEAAKEKAESENPVKLLEIENQQAVLSRELEVNRDMLLERARHELKKELLPIEQVPQMADSLSNIFKGAHLSFVGSENQLLWSIFPLVEMISNVVKDGMDQKGKGSPPGK